MQLLSGSVKRRIFGVIGSIILGTSINASAEESTGDSPLMITGLGDSITAGFNAGGWGTHRENSWLNGTAAEINSQFHRLRATRDGRVESFNFSKVGAKSSGLSSQVDRLLETDQENHSEIVHLLIGANDVCSWPDSHEVKLNAFKSNIESAVDRIISAKPTVNIVLVSIPDLNNLYDVGIEKGCSRRWQQFRICRPLLSRSRTETQRQEFGERLRDANNALRQISAERQDNMYFVETIKDIQFSPEDVSARDCFHPSLKGQALLSEKVWEDGWYNEISGI